MMIISAAAGINPFAGDGPLWALVGLLLLALGVLGRWMLNQMDKKDQRHDAERARLLANFEEERNRWLEAIKESNAKLAAAIDALREAIEKNA